MSILAYFYSFIDSKNRVPGVPRPAPKITGRVVDFCRPRQGRSITRAGRTFAVWCTPPLENGDLVVTPSGEFYVFEVEHLLNPPDMVFAKFRKKAPKSL